MRPSKVSGIQRLRLALPVDKQAPQQGCIGADHGCAGTPSEGALRGDQSERFGVFLGQVTTATPAGPGMHARCKRGAFSMVAMPAVGDKGCGKPSEKPWV